MTTNQTRTGGLSPRALKPRSWPRPPGLAWVALALLGLVQTGCHVDGCSTCGLGNSISNGFQAVGSGVKAVGSRLFNHKLGCGGGGDCGCGGGVEEGVVIDQGVTVVPGGMALPAPGTIVSPPIESDVPQLKPIEDPLPAKATGGTTTSKPTTSQVTPSGANRSGYTTSLPPRRGTGLRRGTEADQAIYSSSNVAAKPSDSPDTSDLLTNIAPVDLPTEVTRKAVATPDKTPTMAPAPAPPAEKAAETAAPTPAEKLSAAEGATLTLPPIVAVSSHQAPGLRRYASIAPTIAGGSSPSTEGLDWLKEKGYRTLIDLRKSSEVEPDFVDAVNDRGMVYISLPIMATRLDPSRLARFDDLISRTDNRPLFFCDTDGSRAALAWYLHQRVVGQEDPHAALSKAEELGISEAEVKLAEDYLATHKPKVKAAMARVAMVTPEASAPTHTPAVATEVKATSALPETPANPSQGATPPATPPKHEEPAPAMLPGENRPQASSAPIPDYRDPAAWKPVAALVLTGIGLPLAFWSRTIVSEFRSSRRQQASLPGAVRRSLETPASSDV